jgi:ubiquinone/menaquinone biosynthesis C-methylase UbiE
MVSYQTVTELPGGKASKEQLERLYQRYRFAYQFCKGKDVLEVACGAGQGLGYLAGAAKTVVGGDIDQENLKFAKTKYEQRNNIRIELLDAQKISFSDKSFDVVIFYEAIYYLKEAERFFDEAYRILREDGLLVICTANKDWGDFNPSPFSTRFFSVPELNSLLVQKFYDVKFYGGFKVKTNGLRTVIISLIKRIAIFLKIIPKTMKGKEFFKRLFFGQLLPLPAEIYEGMTEYIEPVPVAADLPNDDYKVIFAVGRKRGWK